MIDYIIVVAWESGKLVEKVNKKLEDGYTCCGGPGLNGSDKDGYEWFQAMVKFGLRS